MRSLKSTLAGLSAAILGLAAVANAAPVPWSNPSGAVPGLFTWSNGMSDNGLFGSPIVAGNSFTFFPINFRAQSSNGTAQTTSDRLSFTLEVAPGNPFFQGVTVQELGDWAITNGGHVSSDAFLYVTNLNGPVNPPNNPLTGSGGFDSDLTNPPGSGSGNWQITINRNLPAAPNGWTRIQIILDNILQASTPAGGTAIIEKKVGGIIILIPEPASMGLLAGLGTLVIRRRK